MLVNKFKEVKKVISGITWSKAPKMPALTDDATTTDAMFAGITEYAVGKGLAAMKYKDSDGNERQLVIIYSEHAADAYNINAAGVVKPRAWRQTDLKNGRHKFNSFGGGSVHANEIVVRINNIANGVINSYGLEYNHHVMVSLHPEFFGPDAGSMSTKDHNKGDHKNICTRLYKELGIIAHVKSYYSAANNVYGLLGLNTITMQNVIALNPRVVDGIYYFD